VSDKRGSIVLEFKTILLFQDLYETTSEEEDDDDDFGDDVEGVQKSDGVVDLEDLGKVMKKMKQAKVAIILAFYDDLLMCQRKC
jgi:hypothetical protein